MSASDSGSLSTKIEGSEIVIRLPLSVMKSAIPVAFDERYGFEEHDIKVRNIRTFAKEVLIELDRESETGQSLVTDMFDKAFTNACDNGAQGLTYPPRKRKR